MKDGPEKPLLSERLKANMQAAEQHHADLMALASQSFETDIKAILKNAQTTIARDLAAQHRAIKTEIEAELNHLRKQLGLYHQARKWSPLLLALAVLFSLLLVLGATWFWATSYQEWRTAKSLQSALDDSQNGYLLLNLTNGTLARCKFTQTTILCKDMKE
ncbi:hypothetical protein [Pseudovibrio sp. SPO723]|uniref:hypothetical protein n=1 Tax=Nesiotobacter zosterae TaxID=392721 RepID=UPI0029C342A2|nr:hypothetical protein [Pseudovibrio sp. SPO723]MDX5591984.1 hypothetical protein [Pseudovibrio sp. SPO723]